MKQLLTTTEWPPVFLFFGDRVTKQDKKWHTHTHTTMTPKCGNYLIKFTTFFFTFIFSTIHFWKHRCEWNFTENPRLMGVLSLDLFFRWFSLRIGIPWDENYHWVRTTILGEYVIEQGQANRHQQKPSTMTQKTSHSLSLGILAHLVRLGVYNHLRKASKSKVFRFHYNSQKVIGSLGHPSPVYIPFFTYGRGRGSLQPALAKVIFLAPPRQKIQVPIDPWWSKRQFFVAYYVAWLQKMAVHPWKTNMAMENHHFLLGDASSNDWFSIVMLVFLGGIIV